MGIKFILKNNWNVSTEFAGVKNTILVFEKGVIFESNENGEYPINLLGSNVLYTEEDMRQAKDENGQLIFDIIEEEKMAFNLVIEEVDDDDENQIKNWRIQLDVKASRKKLKEVERFFKKEIERILQ